MKRNKKLRYPTTKEIVDFIYEEQSLRAEIILLQNKLMDLEHPDDLLCWCDETVCSDVADDIKKAFEDKLFVPVSYDEIPSMLKEEEADDVVDLVYYYFYNNHKILDIKPCTEQPHTEIHSLSGKMANTLQDLASTKDMLKKRLEKIKSTISSSDDAFLDKIPVELLDRGWQRYHPYSFTIDHRNPLANRSIEEATDCKRQIQLVKQAITKTFPIDESQFVIKDGNDGLYATVLVANTDDNVDIIEQAMEDKGFYRSQPATDKLLYDSKHREWLVIRFEPKAPDDVTAEVHRKYSVLFYLTPKIFEDRIQKHGLLVSNNNPNYRKSGLQAILSDGILSQADKQQLVNSLYSQAQNKSIPNLTPEYSLFAFDIRIMGYDIRFYYDVNEPKGIYTRTLIPPEFIINIEHIVADSNN